MLPLVSIIIPCRNEEKYISKCLDSIILQDYPKQNLEVFIVDGMSEDKTREIVGRYSSKHSFIKLLENQKKFTNFAFNTGVRAAKGDLIVLMGAHAKYKDDYISKSVEYTGKYGADCVGGVLKTEVSKDTIVAKSIALALSDISGAGGSYFRTGAKGPIMVDTVFGGCYKKEVFDKIGFFNENLRRSQDMEFNMRLKKSGGKIFLAPDIVVYYYPSSNLRDFFIHNFIDGEWAVLPLKFISIPLKLRHYIPLIFVSALAISVLLGLFLRPFFYISSGIVFLYLLFLLYPAVKISLREKNPAYLFFLPVSLAIRHFAYGFGSVFGIIQLLK